MRRVIGLSVVWALVLAVGAQAHEHKPPHKGTLVEFGEEFAHLELVIDAATGKVSGYVLDGEAENPVRVKQNTIEITVLKADKSVDFSVTLTQQANDLSGEKVGDSSEFAGASEKLKGVTTFDGKVVSIDVKGKPFKDVKFNFPKGNE
jgi:peptidoglycan/xylan/chitin deacetylase (PgdA/CDA1 family)